MENEVQQVEAPAAEESLSDVASRYRQENLQPQQPAEQSAPVATPEPPPAAAEPEAPAAEEAPPAEEDEEAFDGYTPEEIRLAKDILENQPDHPQYDVALAIFEDLGLIDPADFEDDEIDDEDLGEYDYENLSPDQQMMLELQQQVAELQAARESDMSAAEQERLNNIFFSDLEQVFNEGEAFPRDRENWTPTQEIQAIATAALGSAEAAKEMLAEYGKANFEQYLESKPEPGETGTQEPVGERPGSGIEGDVEAGSLRRSIASIANNHATQTRAGGLTG